MSDVQSGDVVRDDDPRECGWLGCGHPDCGQACKPVSVAEWHRWNNQRGAGNPPGSDT